MAAPTLSSAYLKINGSYYEGTITDPSTDAGTGITTPGKIAVTIPGTHSLDALVVKAAASAASSLYLSNVVDTEKYAAVAATTAADIADVTFNIYDGMKLYISAAATTKIANDTELSAYVVELTVDPTMDVVDIKQVVGLGLGNTVVVEISKYKYNTGGIQISSPSQLALFNVVAPLFVSVKGNLGSWFDSATNKLIVYKSGSTEQDVGTEVYAQLVMLKQ